MCSTVNGRHGIRTSAWQACWAVLASWQCGGFLTCNNVDGGAAGFESISVLVQRPHMVPVRCGFWKAATGSPQHQPQTQPLIQPQLTPVSQPQPPSESQSGAHSQPKAASSAEASPPPPSSGPRAPSRQSSEGRLGLSRENSASSSSLHRKGSDGKPPKHRLAPGFSGSLASAVPGSFSPDVLLAAVEPFGAEVLELQKLGGFRGRIGYSPTRNRQCHMYTITERPNACSAPLKRVFLRYGMHRKHGA